VGCDIEKEFHISELIRGALVGAGHGVAETKNHKLQIPINGRASSWVPHEIDNSIESLSILQQIQRGQLISFMNHLWASPNPREISYFLSST
jgi:hypothetical protein